METLIVSRTRAGNSRCIGGIVLENNRSVRLVQPNGEYWPQNCDKLIGDVWDLQFINRPNLAPPFIEDVLVQGGTFVRRVAPLFPEISVIATQMGDCYWRGSLASLYVNGGVIHFQGNGKAYIEEGDEPNLSTGFWVPDQNLRLAVDRKHYFYQFQQLAYVGEEPPLDIIPAGTLCRVSLARLWRPDFADWDRPSRYYLQLSGWYI